MNDFEELARRAADAARDNTISLDVPPLTPRRRPAAVVGLLLLAGAVTVGALLATRDDTPRTDVTGNDNDSTVASEWPYRLTWTEFATDVEFSAVDLPLDLGDPTIEGPAGRTLLFGNVGDDPFGDGDLLVLTLETTAGVDSESRGDPIAVRGKEGYQNSFLDQFGFDSAFAWQESETLAVVVASRSSDIDALVEYAETLVFDGGAVSAPDPAGLTLLVDADGLPFGATAYQRVGSISSLVSDRQESVLALFSEPARAEAVLIARYLAADAQPVTIRGTDGWLLSPDLPGQGYGGDTAMWVERGVVFTLRVSPGLDPVALAAQLEQVDEARWSELVAETQARETGSGESVAEGEFTVDDQEVVWRAFFDEENGICVLVRTGQRGSSSCGPLSNDFRSYQTFRTPSSNSAIVAYGVAGAEVERIVIEGADDMITIQTLAVGRQRVFGVAVPASEVTGDLVAFAADGAEVWRQGLNGGLNESAIPDNPSAPVELATGVSGSAEWRLSSEGDSLCLELTLPSEGAASCSGGLVVWIETGDTIAIGGVAPSCVTSVVATTRAQDPVSADLTVIGDQVAFGIVTSPQMGGLTLTDAAGSVIAELRPGDPTITEMAC